MSSSNLMELLKQKRAESARQRTIKPEQGRNRYRLLPSWDKNNDKFWAEWGQHFIKDATGKVVAVYVCADKTHGTPCDICAAIEQGIQNADNDATIKQLEEAKSGSRVLLNVLWIGNGGKCPENEPQVLEVAPTVFSGFKGVGGIASLFDEWPDLLDPKNGLEIIIEKSGTGKDTRYGVQVAGAHQGPKVVTPDILAKIHNLDLLVAQESEQGRLRALTSLGTITGRPVALAAPRAAPMLPASVAKDLDKAQDDALRALEEASAPAVEQPSPAAPVATPAPVSPPATAPAAPAAPVASAAAANEDEELDKLLANLG